MHHQPPHHPPHGDTQAPAQEAQTPCPPPVTEPTVSTAAEATPANEAPVAQTVAAPASPPPPSLEEQLLEAQHKATEHHDAWLRAKAEGENIRRRAQEDISKAHKFAVERFASDLLAVKDSLEAALANQSQSVESFQAGVELTLKQLVAAFDKSGLKETNPVGEKFDPHFHQAISMVESDQEPNTVVTVLQKGYLIAERVLRPALVMVAKARPVAPPPVPETPPPAPAAGAPAATPPTEPPTA
ncbi:MAG: grpE [Proteobacteria bacterium]|nr:grpE [Pseudomonadota bacterium]